MYLFERYSWFVERYNPRPYGSVLLTLLQQLYYALVPPYSLQGLWASFDVKGIARQCRVLFGHSWFLRDKSGGSSAADKPFTALQDLASCPRTRLPQGTPKSCSLSSTDADGQFPSWKGLDEVFICNSVYYH